MLAPGTRLGPYEVVAPLGAGGMGEVFRARDTRLGREVAIKVLPQHLSANAEVRARFEREAKTVSSLNHPNICTLFDVGRSPGEAGSGDTDYLVMELVEGETLAQRLARGALPAAEVLKLGAQIADALDRAHRAGVVHRDLKPGNVMLAKSGAKLMDFGLARATGLAGGAGSGSTLATMTHSPTVAAPLTAEGTIVGTFQYMAPEQLEGKEADGRSDLWALGCVLYEMATGRRAFDGSTQASLISAIMRDTPRPMSELAPMSPAALERLAHACLAKDPADRLQSAHDLKLQLEWIATGSSQTGATTAARPKKSSSVAFQIGVSILAALAGVVATKLVTRGGSGGAPSVSTRARLLVTEPPRARLNGRIMSVALSPDGSWITFVAADSSGAGSLWLRPLNALTARPVPGTENGDLPFWSPDGRAIGFFADGKLKRVGVDGGRPQTLCDAPDPRGGAWGSGGTIVFAPSATGGLFSVPADGGDATALLRPDSARGEVALRFPAFLPGEDRFVFVSLPRRGDHFDVHLGRIGSAERRTLMQAAASPVPAGGGWLVTTLGDRLVAQRFDSRAGRMMGKPVQIGDAPAVAGHDGTRAVTASLNGTLAYSGISRSNTTLAWMDRGGRVDVVRGLPPGFWTGVWLSPDGDRAMVLREDAAGTGDLWLVDLSTSQARPFSPRTLSRCASPIWSADGSRVVYSHGTRGPANLVVQAVDGGTPEPLYESPVLFKNPYGWSPDGKHLTMEQPSPETGWDLWLVPMEGEHRPVPLVQGPANEGGGWFSPDGRWLAYYSDEAGSLELYVRPFPGPGPRHAIAGTRSAVSAFISGCWWSADSREMVVWGADGLVRTIAVTPGPNWSAGRSRDLLRLPDEVVAISPTPDLKRFLATVQLEPSTPAAIVVDLNWTQALGRVAER